MTGLWGGDWRGCSGLESRKECWFQVEADGQLCSGTLGTVGSGAAGLPGRLSSPLLDPRWEERSGRACLSCSRI